MRLLPVPVVAASTGKVIDSLGREWDPLKHPRGRDGKFIRVFHLVRMFLGNNEPWATGHVSQINDDGSIRVKVNATKDNKFPNYVGHEVDVHPGDIESINEKATLAHATLRKDAAAKYASSFTPEASKSFFEKAGLAAGAVNNQGAALGVAGQLAQNHAVTGNRAKYHLALYAHSISGDNEEHSNDDFIGLLRALDVPDSVIDDTPDGLSGLQWLADKDNEARSPHDDPATIENWVDVAPITPGALREAVYKGGKTRIKWMSDGNHVIVDAKGVEHAWDPNAGPLTEQGYNIEHGNAPKATLPDESSFAGFHKEKRPTLTFNKAMALSSPDSPGDEPPAVMWARPIWDPKFDQLGPDDWHTETNPLSGTETNVFNPDYFDAHHDKLPDGWGGVGVEWNGTSWHTDGNGNFVRIGKGGGGQLWTKDNWFEPNGIPVKNWDDALARINGDENASEPVHQAYVDAANALENMKSYNPDFDFSDKKDVAALIDRVMSNEWVKKDIADGNEQSFGGFFGANQGKDVTLKPEDGKALQNAGVQASEDIGTVAGSSEHAAAQIDKVNPSTADAPDKEGDLPAQTGILDARQWKKVGGQGGSNLGGVFEDENGQRWYVKKGKTDHHAKNESLAAQFYEAAGINVAKQELAITPFNDALGTASPLIPDAKQDLAKHKHDQAYVDKIREGFVVDAWLANWDVAGLVLDNVVTDANGDPVRVDPGGALWYRAQGKPKPGLGGVVSELNTLRNPDMSTAAPFFKDITPEQAKASAQRVVSITPDQIDALVDGVNFSPDDKVNPGEAVNPGYLKEVLKARRQNIANIYDIPLPENQSEPKPEADSHDWSDINSVEQVQALIGKKVYWHHSSVSPGADKVSGPVHINDVLGAHVKFTDENGHDTWAWIADFDAVSPVNDDSTDQPKSVFEVLDDPGASGDGYWPGTHMWGKYGAAGVLVRHKGEDGKYRYLMVQRGPIVSSNKGKWQFPGGALNSKENDYQGTARELQEELSPPDDFLGKLTPLGESKFSHESGWHYTNIIADTPDQFDPTVDGTETGDAKWVTEEELLNLPLHPSVEKVLPELLAKFKGHDESHGTNEPEPEPTPEPAAGGLNPDDHYELSFDDTTANILPGDSDGSSIYELLAEHNIDIIDEDSAEASPDGPAFHELRVAGKGADIEALWDEIAKPHEKDNLHKYTEKVDAPDVPKDAAEPDPWANAPEEPGPDSTDFEKMVDEKGPYRWNGDNLKLHVGDMVIGADGKKFEIVKFQNHPTGVIVKDAQGKKYGRSRLTLTLVQNEDDQFKGAVPAGETAKQKPVPDALIDSNPDVKKLNEQFDGDWSYILKQTFHTDLNEDASVNDNIHDIGDAYLNGDIDKPELLNQLDELANEIEDPKNPEPAEALHWFVEKHAHIQEGVEKPEVQHDLNAYFDNEWADVKDAVGHFDYEPDKFVADRMDELADQYKKGDLEKPQLAEQVQELADQLDNNENNSAASLLKTVASELNNWPDEAGGSPDDELKKMEQSVQYQGPDFIDGDNTVELANVLSQMADAANDGALPEGFKLTLGGPNKTVSFEKDDHGAPVFVLRDKDNGDAILGAWDVPVVVDDPSGVSDTVMSTLDQQSTDEAQHWEVGLTPEDNFPDYIKTMYDKWQAGTLTQGSEIHFANGYTLSYEGDSVVLRDPNDNWVNSWDLHYNSPNTVAGDIKNTVGNMGSQPKEYYYDPGDDLGLAQQVNNWWDAVDSPWKPFIFGPMDNFALRNFPDENLVVLEDTNSGEVLKEFDTGAGGLNIDNVEQAINDLINPESKPNAYAPKGTQYGPVVDPSGPTFATHVKNFLESGENGDLPYGDYLKIGDGHFLTYTAEHKNWGLVPVYELHDKDGNTVKSWAATDLGTPLDTTIIDPDAMFQEIKDTVTHASAPDTASTEKAYTLSDLAAIRDDIPKNLSKVLQQFPTMSAYQVKQYRNAGFALDDAEYLTPDNANWHKAVDKAIYNLEQAGPLASDKLEQVKKWKADVTGATYTPPAQKVNFGPGYADVPEGSKNFYYAPIPNGQPMYAAQHPDGKFYVYDSAGHVQQSLAATKDDFDKSSAWLPYVPEEHPGTQAEGLSPAFDLGPGFASLPDGATPLFVYTSEDGNTGQIVVVQHPNGSLYYYNSAGYVDPSFSTKEFFENQPDYAPWSPKPALPDGYAGAPDGAKLVAQNKNTDTYLIEYPDGALWMHKKNGVVKKANYNNAQAYIDAGWNDLQKPGAANVVEVTPDDLTGVEPPPDGAKLAFKNLANGGYVYQYPNGNYYVHDKAGGVDPAGPNEDVFSDPTTWAPAKMKEGSAPASAPAAPQKTGKNLPDADGKPIYIGDKVKSTNPSDPKVYTVVGFEKDSVGGVFVKAPGEKKRARKPWKLRLAEESQQPTPTPGKTPYAKQVEPDPSSPWYGKPKPEAPVKSDVTGVAKYVDDAWMAKADANYKKRMKSKNPNWTEKPLTQSSTYQQYLEVQTAGSITQLDKLLSQGRITQEMYDDAKAQILKNMEPIKKAQEEFDKKFNEWKEQVKEWRKANGLPAIQLMGMDAGNPVKLNNSQAKAWMNKHMKPGALNPSGKLSPAAHKAIQSQKSSNVSDYLRNKLKLKSMTDPSSWDSAPNATTLKNLKKAIEESPPLPQDFVTTRMFDITAFVDPVTRKRLKSVDSPTKLLHSIQEDFGFAETSVGSYEAGATKAWSGAIHMELRLPAGTRGVWTLHPEEDFGYSGERGFILEAGLFYYIHSVEYEGNGSWLVKAEVIPKDVGYENFNYFQDVNPFE